jgi:hypothetical protein
MLEIKNNKVKIWYEFDSKYADDEELYARYDFDEFHYDIDIDEVKEEITYRIAKITNDGGGGVIILNALNELEEEELINWFAIIRGWGDFLEEHYKDDAMEYFIREHPIATKDDYDAMEYDRRRCEE